MRERTQNVLTTQRNQSRLEHAASAKHQHDHTASVRHAATMQAELYLLKQMRKVIGVDLMGSEVSPDTICKAVLAAIPHLPSVTFVLFHTKDFALPQEYQQESVLADSLISMEEAPAKAVRAKKRSTLVLGVKALRDKKIDAFLSCGNTGALVAASHLYLEPLSGITRPALVARFPTSHGTMLVLDVGANLTTKASQLIEFAHLGARLVQEKFNSTKPKVALLNIGVESEKGTKELREAYHALEALETTSFEFIGNIEPKEVWRKPVDVLVTSGFSGNIFLKTAEGVASFVLDVVADRLGADITKLRERLGDEASQGALVAGVNGLVIKCHGSSSQKAILNAILGIN